MVATSGDDFPACQVERFQGHLRLLADPNREPERGEAFSNRQSVTRKMVLRRSVLADTGSKRGGGSPPSSPDGFLGWKRWSRPPNGRCSGFGAARFYGLPRKRALMQQRVAGYASHAYRAIPRHTRAKVYPGALLHQRAHGRSCRTHPKRWGTKHPACRVACVPKQSGCRFRLVSGPGLTSDSTRRDRRLVLSSPRAAASHP